MTRRYRVVFTDGTSEEHTVFHLAQKAFNERADATHFDRYVVGGWIPLGWRGERPPAEREATA